MLGADGARRRGRLLRHFLTVDNMIRNGRPRMMGCCIVHRRRGGGLDVLMPIWQQLRACVGGNRHLRKKQQADQTSANRLKGFACHKTDWLQSLHNSSANYAAGVVKGE